MALSLNKMEALGRENLAKNKPVKSAKVSKPTKASKEATIFAQKPVGLIAP